MATEAGYPIAMVHPQRRPAVLGTGRKQGTPEQFPNVTVNSAAQEADHRRRGYLRYGEAPQVTVDHYEFPKILRHPDHRDKIDDRQEAQIQDGKIVGTFLVRGEPEIMPDVIAKDKDEEEEWRQKGYKPAGEYNRAFLNSVIDNSICEETYEPVQYPKWDGDQLLLFDPDEERIEPTSEFPKMVNGSVVRDPRLSPEPDPHEFPKWVHKNNVPSDASVLVKTPKEEFEVRKKWAEAEPVLEGAME